MEDDTGPPKKGDHSVGVSGEGAWLVGEWRLNGERKYDLSNLPPLRFPGALKTLKI